MTLKTQTIETYSQQETERFAEGVAAQAGDGDIFLLHGDLGAGKTVFCRAFLRALCGDATQEVPSPTFTLLQSYDTSHGPLWHFDLYRLSAPDEVYEIGWEDALSGGIVLVEWPERLGALAPEDAYDIVISIHAGQADRRTIKVVAHDRA